MSGRILKTLLCTAALTIGSLGAAQAAGFYIQEQSVSGLGSAFSGSVTNLDDASTVYFNPAGMTKLDGIHVQGAAHLIVPNADLDDRGSTAPATGDATPITSIGSGGNPYDPSPVPNFFATYQVNDKWWAGIGVTAPFGLGSEYDSNWFGRYDSIKTELTTIDIAPSIAYKVNDQLSLGAGINIQYADAELTSAAFGGTEGLSRLEGDDISWGYNIGIQYKPLETTTLGASYRSSVGHDLDGRISNTGTTGADFNVAGSADLNLPDIATFGVAHDLTQKLTLQAQATWFGWNSFSDISPVTDEAFSVLVGDSFAPGDIISSTVQGYQTTWAFAAGAEYDYSDVLTLRGGFQYDETPTTDQFRTSRTPDGDRTRLSTGATYRFNDQVALDAAATYIFISEETINVARNNALGGGAAINRVRADTGGNVGILALGLNYKF